MQFVYTQCAGIDVHKRQIQHDHDLGAWVEPQQCGLNCAITVWVTLA
jgi:hypothetical protein